jgi:translation elongation factor P/translation initiation factor 5A
VDIDKDGKLDILSGSYSRSGADTMAGLFQVLNGKGDNAFTKAKALNGSDGEPLLITFQGDDKVTEAICTRPSATDWDNDGDLDLIVGNFKGSFYLFKGEGDGKFSPKAEPIQSDGSHLALSEGGYHSDPFAIDWDGDGDLDLLSGSANGGVHWSENSAGAGKTPELGKFNTLIPPAMQVSYGDILREADLVGPAGSTRVWADDINGDGKLDILVGDSVTLIEPAAGLDEADFKKRQTAWEKEQEQLMEKMTKGTPDEQKASQKAYMALRKKRDEFISEDMTGFVWLYLQK